LERQRNKDVGYSTNGRAVRTGFSEDELACPNCGHELDAADAVESDD